MKLSPFIFQASLILFFNVNKLRAQPTVTGFGITGPSCVTKNDIKEYQLGTADQVNATNYSWWITGSSQGITPGADGKVIVSYGPDFKGGILSVGVGYTVAPWYKQFSVKIAVCSDSLAIWQSAAPAAMPVKDANSIRSGVIYPTTGNADFTFIPSKNVKSLMVLDISGRQHYKSGSITAGQKLVFGEKLSPATYFVQVWYSNDQRETMLVVKTK